MQYIETHWSEVEVRIGLVYDYVYSEFQSFLFFLSPKN